MGVRAEHLAYFKDLLEGRAELSWGGWFARHRAELEHELPKPAFVRLKHKGIEEVERVLRAAGVAFTPDPAALRRERYHALFAVELLDERGRVRPELLRSRFDGAWGELLDGDVAGARRTLDAFVAAARESGAQEQWEELSFLAFYGEAELEGGDPVVGRGLLEALARIEEHDDLLDPLRRRARELLGIR